jgi:hypothetical protein
VPSAKFALCAESALGDHVSIWGEMQYVSAMKIDRTAPSRTASPVKRNEKAGKAQTTQFSRHLDSDRDAAEQIGTVAPVHSVDALLSIQEVGDATDGEARKKARRWAVDLLDILDQLRIGIISGGVAKQDLERITTMVEHHRVQSDDPKLNMILDEIELRARVELAKFERDN